MNDRRRALMRKFQAVAAERIRGISIGLIELGEGRGAPEDVREIARALHTLKGESNMLGLARVAEVSHAAETLLLGGGEVPDAATCARLQRAFDVVDEAIQGRLSDEDATLDALLAELAAAARIAPPLSPSLPPRVSSPLPASGSSGPPRIPGSSPRPPSKASERWVQIDAARVSALCESVTDFGGDFRAFVARFDALLGAPSKVGAPGRAGEGPTSGAALRLLTEELDRCRARLDDLTGAAWALRLAPVEPVLAELVRHAQKLAQRQGKRLRTTAFAGGAAVERALLEELRDPLLHLVQNAIDHGIEPPGARGDKPAEASLTLHAETVGASVVLTVADDGRGIDTARVREVAAERGLVAPEAAAGLPEREVLDLLFVHGFSTLAGVTDVSGRGVGLDVVRRKVEAYGGTAAVLTVPGRGTRFTLTLPAEVSREHALVVELAGTLYGVSCRTILEIVRASDDDALTFRGEVIPRRSLAGSLGVGAPGPEPLAIVLEAAGRKVAFSVPGLVGEHHLLRRPLDPALAGLDYLTGSATLDDGRLVLLLLAAGLIRRQEARGPRIAPLVTPRRPRVLVVDDAKLVRQVLADLLTDAGVDVETAPDGRAALSRVTAAPPDLLLSDVDMPLMDGLELLRRVRARLPDLPVILFTGRASDDSRNAALEGGARAYLSKGEFQPHSLVETVSRFLTKAS